MTPGQKQAAYDARRAAIEVAIQAMPESAQVFIREWRFAVEQLGRHGADGSAIIMAERFVQGMQAVLDERWECFKTSLGKSFGAYDTYGDQLKRPRVEGDW